MVYVIGSSGAEVSSKACRKWQRRKSEGSSSARPMTSQLAAVRAPNGELMGEVRVNKQNQRADMLLSRMKLGESRCRATGEERLGRI